MALRTPAFNDAKSYGFEWLRALAETDLQEGVFGAGDLKVTAAAAGGMRVDLAAGQACIKGDSGVAGTGLSQGLFIVVNDAAVANAATLTNSDPTNPRLDQIVLRVRDSADLGSGADDAVLEVVTGAPTAGATLDNRNGAAALPADRIRLADVLVPAASAAVTAGNVRDRRPWARGAYRRIVAATADYTVSNTSYSADLDATNLKPRIECSGVPLRLRIVGMTFNATTGDRLAIKFKEDGANDVLPDTSWTRPGIFNQSINYIVDYLPAAGSHTYAIQAFSSAAGGIVKANATIPFQISIEEMVRQNADNT